MVTLKFYIIEHLKERMKGAWVPGGEIEKYIISFTKFKPGTVNRILRSLSEDGTIEKEYRKFQGSPKFVVYRKI